METTASKLGKSMRSGHHATVYGIRRDPSLKVKNVIRDTSKPVFPFVSGSEYRGQWNNDVKEGFGIQINPDGTKYEGEWSRGKCNGRGTLWAKKGKTFIRQYVGDWSDGKMDGEGIYYYPNGDIYRGNWSQGVRSGHGRLEITNGDIYEGSWKRNMKDGIGTMTYSNGNIYEGMWEKDQKEGPGQYFYAATTKIYKGEWAEDQPRCGEYAEPDAEEMLRFVKVLPKGMYSNNFALPELGLANPESIVEMATSDVRMARVDRDGGGDTYSRLSFSRGGLNPDTIHQAHELFNSLPMDTLETVSIFDLEDVFLQFGLDLSPENISEIIVQLEQNETLRVTFNEVVEIATYIKESASSI